MNEFKKNPHTGLKSYMLAIGSKSKTFTPDIADGEDDDSDAEFLDDDVNVTEIVPSSQPSQSLLGDDLRQYRKDKLFNSDLFETTEVQSQIEKNTQRPNQAPGQVVRDVNLLRNLRISEGMPYATRRLRTLNLQLSPSQRDTPGDENCFLHAIVDHTR